MHAVEDVGSGEALVELHLAGARQEAVAVEDLHLLKDRALPRMSRSCRMHQYYYRELMEGGIKTVEGVGW